MAWLALVGCVGPWPLTDCRVPSKAEFPDAYSAKYCSALLDCDPTPTGCKGDPNGAPKCSGGYDGGAAADCICADWDCDAAGAPVVPSICADVCK